MKEKISNILDKFKIFLPIAYMILIFYLSSIPLEFPDIINKLDPTKFSFHVAEYTVLSLLLFNVSKSFKTSFVISSLYGVTDEIHQYFVPFRTFSLLDMLADALGSFIGIKIFIWLKQRRLKISRSLPLSY
jgi:hypothetical protein